jgi:hypothetical protein
MKWINKRNYCSLLSIIILALFFNSCKKLDQVALSEKDLNSAERKFFFTNRTGDVTEAKLVDFLIRQNLKKNFVEKTIKLIGFPKWGKIATIKSKSSTSGRGASDSLITSYIIPFVRDSQNFVNASVIISVYPNDTAFKYRSDWEYKYKINGSPSVDSTAEAHALFFMFLDNITFGYTEFNIIDTSLFPEAHVANGGSKKLTILSTSFSTSGRGNTSGSGQDCLLWGNYVICPTPTSPECSTPSGCDYLSCPSQVCRLYYGCVLWDLSSVQIGGSGPTIGTGGGGSTIGSGGSGSGGGSPNPCPGITTYQRGQTTTYGCEPGWNGITSPDPSFSFTINGITFTASNYPGINDGLPWKWWENASILAPFGGLPYGSWAINYLSLNPLLPFSAFQNLFMTLSEGPEEGITDDFFWDDPNNMFPPQSLPSWASFEVAFLKRENYTTYQVYYLIGGQVGSIFGGAQNSCAARISRALNYSGVVIPNIPGKTFLGGDGKYYFVMAIDLNRWMRKTFGCANPNLSIGEYLNTNSLHFTPNTINNLVNALYSPTNTIKGIFSAVWDYPPGSTTGHADLINTISPWCDGKCHLNEKHKYIDIWPLQ